jgi:hypothetical protein
MGPDCLRKQKAVRCVSNAPTGFAGLESPGFSRGEHVKWPRPHRRSACS